VKIAVTAVLDRRGLFEVRRDLLLHSLQPLFDEAETAHHVNAMKAIIEGHTLLQTEVDCHNIARVGNASLQVRCSHPRLMKTAKDRMSFHVSQLPGDPIQLH
jgi:hypothetical protein